MAFTKEHAQQMADLRRYARSLAKLPAIRTAQRAAKLSPAERQARNAALAARLTQILGPSETTKKNGGTASK